jgi:hypothetical protein
VRVHRVLARSLRRRQRHMATVRHMVMVRHMATVRHMVMVRHMAKVRSTGSLDGSWQSV